MATYKVTDPTTGKTVSLEGNTPPTETELEDIFSNLNSGSSSQKQSPVSYFGDVKQSAIKEIKGTIQGIPEMARLGSRIMSTPRNIVKYPFERAIGIPSNETSLNDSKQAISAIPDIQKEIIKGTIQDIASLANPKEAFRNKPIGTIANVAAIVAPAIKGVSAVANGAEMSSTSANVIRKAFEKVGNAALGVPGEAMAARIKNPSALKTAFSHREVADQMAESVKNLQKTIGDLNTTAKDKLSSSRYIEDGAIPKTEIADTIRLTRQSMGGVFSEESKKAVAALKRVKETYKKLTNTVSQKQVKELIDQIDDDINWDNTTASRTNEALIGVRTRLDGMLKDLNPGYKEAMQPVSEAIQIRDEFQKAFNVSKKTKRDFYAGDQTVNKIKSSLKDSKIETQSILQRYQDVTGEDFISKIQNSNNKAAFYGGETNGSRRTGPMAVVGSFGGPAGAAAGYVGGLFIDKYGKNAAGAIADVLASPKMTKYLSVLDQAAVKGPRNVLAVHAALMEKDQNYAAEIGRKLANAGAQ